MVGTGSLLSKKNLPTQKQFYITYRNIFRMMSEIYIYFEYLFKLFKANNKPKSFIYYYCNLTQVLTSKFSISIEVNVHVKIKSRFQHQIA